MWIDVKQNTDEWFGMRVGKITSSKFSTIMANEGKAFGNPAVEYAEKLALERVTGKRDESASLSSKYLDRGHELEPDALKLYEFEQLCTVTNGGFNTNGENINGLDGNLGDSPDGVVLEDNGSVEVKSVIPKTHWKRLKKGGIDTSYKWQIQGHIWLGNYDYCDFVSYCPEMPDGKRLFVERVLLDVDMITRLNKRIIQFELMIEKNIEILKS
mgnify:CR=1 FL=1